MWVHLLLKILILSDYCLSLQAFELVCYNGTIENYQVVLPNNTKSIMKIIDKSKETVFYTFGYTGTRDGLATVTVVNAYLNDSTIVRNVILLDWAPEASEDPILGINASYGLKAMPNTLSVGTQMGVILLELSNEGLDLLKVLLVGHSLGAHLWGHAGRAVKAGNKSVGMIIGLDPAGPLYDQIAPAQLPLDRTCAISVINIHSDPGNYGMNHSTGTVDIWPNYGSYLNGINRQPGCPNGTFPRFSTNDRCSHNTSWMFLVEGLKYIYNLIASQAVNYYSWVAANGTSSNTICIGDFINKTAEGNYYLTTNKMPLYGKGEAGLRP